MAGKGLLIQGEVRRREILLFLRAYIKRVGWAPTIQEICDGVGLVSPNAVRSHLTRLQELGFIKMEPRIARAIALQQPQPSLRLLSTVKPDKPVKAEVVEIVPQKKARSRREKIPA